VYLSSCHYKRGESFYEGLYIEENRENAEYELSTDLYEWLHGQDLTDKQHGDVSKVKKRKGNLKIIQ
jgi:hypothetical protein